MSLRVWVSGGQSRTCACVLRPARGLMAGGNRPTPKTRVQAKVDLGTGHFLPAPPKYLPTEQNKNQTETV